MRQLFERVLVLVPLLALAPATGASAQSYGRAWSQVLDSAFFATNSGDTIYLGKWNIIQPMEPWVLQEWGRKAATTSKWHTNPDCQAAMAYARAALDSADIQAGIGSFAGEYFGPSTDSSSTNDADVIVVATFVAQMPDGFGTLIHEAWHRATGATEDDITALNAKLDSLYNGRSIESCHDEAREEEEKPCGAGADCTGTPTPPTPKCEERQVYVRWTEWVFVETGRRYVWEGWFDPDGGDDPDNPNPAGRYVLVVTGYSIQVEKGEWRTQTVCSN